MTHPIAVNWLTTAESRLPELLNQLEQIIAVESPSDDLEALGRSADLVAAIGTELLGVEPERITIDDRPHLRWRFGPGAPRVVLLAHHDTVWPVGTLERIPFSVIDGTLRGPGCFDMLTGLAMALHALSMIIEQDPAGANGVSLLINADEEVGSMSSRDLIEDEARSARAVLVLEASGPGGALKTARKGVSMYQQYVHGLAAHAGLEPERGVNATIELAHQVLAISETADAELGTTVTPTVASAGQTRNTVPDRAVVAIDARVMTVEEQLRVDKALHALTPRLPGSTLELTGGPNRPPMEPGQADDLFQLAQRAAARLGLAPLEEIAVGGGSDGNFTAGIGIPTLDGMGAVGGGAHAEDEHVLVAAIPERLALLIELIMDLRASDAPAQSDRESSAV